VVHGLCVDKYYSRLFHHIPICSSCTFHIRSYLEMRLQRASACVKTRALLVIVPAILWSRSCDLPVFRLTLLRITCNCDLWKPPRLDKIKYNHTFLSTAGTLDPPFPFMCKYNMAPEAYLERFWEYLQMLYHTWKGPFLQGPFSRPLFTYLKISFHIWQGFICT